MVERTVHFGIGVSPRPHPDLVLVPLFRDVMVVVKGRQRLAADAPLFYVPRIRLSEKVVDAMRGAGRLPQRLVPCGDLELVKSLVLHGAGTGVLPWRVAAYGTAPGALRLVDSTLPHELDVGYLIYRADHHRTRAARMLHDELVHTGRGLEIQPLPCRVTPLRRLAR